MVIPATILNGVYQSLINMLKSGASCCQHSCSFCKRTKEIHIQCPNNPHIRVFFLLRNDSGGGEVSCFPILRKFLPGSNAGSAHPYRFPRSVASTCSAPPPLAWWHGMYWALDKGKWPAATRKSTRFGLFENRIFLAQLIARIVCAWAALPIQRRVLRRHEPIRRQEVGGGGRANAQGGLSARPEQWSAAAAASASPVASDLKLQT